MASNSVDVCLTTIHSRLEAVEHCITSILEQKDVDPIVYLFLSKEPYLLDRGVSEVPENLVNLQKRAKERFRIIFCKNWGPYRKFVPYLHNHWGKNRRFITADDDTIYPTYWLSRILSDYEENGCVIGYRGHRIIAGREGFATYRSWMKGGILSNPNISLIPTGKDGVLYNTSFFDPNVLNMGAATKLAPTADDLWLKWHLAYNGIQTHIINTDYRSSTFEETEYCGSLYKNFNKGGGNDEAVNNLHSYFKNEHQFDLLSRILEAS